MIQGHLFLGSFGITTAFCSFFSDFVTADARHFSLVLRRRAFALDLIVVNTYVLANILTLLLNGSFLESFWVTFAIGGIGKHIILEWSGAASSPAQWEFRHTTWHAYTTWLGFACFECIYSSPANFQYSLDACGLVVVPLRVVANALGANWSSFFRMQSKSAAPVWPIPFPPGFSQVCVAVGLLAWALTVASDANLAVPLFSKHQSTRSRIVSSPEKGKTTEHCNRLQRNQKRKSRKATE